MVIEKKDLSKAALLFLVASVTLAVLWLAKGLLSLQHFS